VCLPSGGAAVFGFRHQRLRRRRGQPVYLSLALRARSGRTHSAKHFFTLHPGNCV
jgi:hypothetical protein